MLAGCCSNLSLLLFRASKQRHFLQTISSLTSGNSCHLFPYRVRSKSVSSASDVRLRASVTFRFLAATRLQRLCPDRYVASHPVTPARTPLVCPKARGSSAHCSRRVSEDVGPWCAGPVGSRPAPASARPYPRCDPARSAGPPVAPTRAGPMCRPAGNADQ